MNEKEIAEIKRRFRKDRSNITHVRGCCVNTDQKIISEFNQSFAQISEEEADKFLTLLKKTLSGTAGKNLRDIAFEAKAVLEGEEHKLLMALRSSELKDEQAVQQFFQKVIESLHFETSYLIMLAHEKYDIPFKGKDDETFEDASNEVYSYVLCSICPIKLTKPALSYQLQSNTFCSLEIDHVISNPELGFLFPAFDERSANIYGSLYYTKNTAENYEEFVDAVFHSEIPMAAERQKETFQNILSESLAEDANVEIIQAVHDELHGMIEEHAANKEQEPLTLSKEKVQNVLQTCGVAETNRQAFAEKFEQEFGADAEILPKNIVDAKIAVSTPEVSIKVTSDRSDLIQTRVIDGAKYILIRAEDGVEVNGITVNIE